jgi:hypothetical protein
LANGFIHVINRYYFHTLSVQYSFDLANVDGRGLDENGAILLNNKIDLIAGLQLQVVPDLSGDSRLALAGECGTRHGPGLPYTIN